MSGQEEKKWPGMPDRAYPELFTTIPQPQPTERKPGHFTDGQIRQFFEDGFVQVDDFFSRDELDPVRDATADLVEHFAQKFYNAGKITKLYNECGLFQRMSMIEKEFPGANILMNKHGQLPQAYRTLWTNNRLLNLMEQLLGTRDFQGHPVWNLRAKTPKNTATTVPWHQDSAYLDNDSYGVMQVTAWIPLLDSNEQNGCMQMVKGGHQKGLICNHTCCWKDTWYIMLAEDEMEKTLGVDMKKDVVLCPVPYGGALFFSNMIPHRSLPNVSHDIRWSLDLRWQRMDQPVGFYGLKQGLQFSSSSNPNLEINWDSFDAVDRGKEQNKTMGAVQEDLAPIIAGPWMQKWEMTHTNQHTAALEKQQEDLVGWHAP